MDQALGQLDSDTRDLIVRHYVEGCSMTALAENTAQSALASDAMDLDATLGRSGDPWLIDNVQRLRP